MPTLSTLTHWTHFTHTNTQLQWDEQCAISCNSGYRPRPNTPAATYTYTCTKGTLVAPNPMCSPVCALPADLSTFAHPSGGTCAGLAYLFVGQVCVCVLICVCVRECVCVRGWVCCVRVCMRACVRAWGKKEPVLMCMLVRL